MIRDIDLFSIEARRAPKSDKISIDVRKDYKSNVPKIEFTGKREAHISFGFMVHYSNVGIIRMEGSMVYEGPLKELKKSWESDKQMPEDVSKEVHNAIMEGCIPEAVSVAKDIGLPPPIPLPRAPVQRKNSRSK